MMPLFPLFEDERGQTTLEYTLVLALASAISIFATIWLIRVMTSMVAVLAVRMATFLSGN
jgi:hypothetical protein